MRSLRTAFLLALAPAVMAVAPAAAQQQWSGASLTFTAPANCRLAVERAFLQGSGWSASIRVVLRNRSAQTLTVRGDAELQGNGQRKSAPFGPRIIAGNEAAEVTLLNPYGGSLDGSRLTVRVLNCPAG
ncbi:hypothetical protein BKE38_18815 [Pseudoroseomonas deserti]|uniref:Uncharacterized protein n=1 Tax=Teichococcus deserti TaxID=1817963 RepID=A0A1V2GZE5_9PROT|nr:hypothetical protein [Pseudoroseomonas deserti]ONG50236.1 hypothetical protein BKE38_18815 [Pseudoroseomonas deserti]